MARNKFAVNQVLELKGDTYCVKDGEDTVGNWVLCESFVKRLLKTALPDFVRFRASRSPFDGSKRIWIRDGVKLGNTSPSSWTWAKNGVIPDGYAAGGGMFLYLHVLIRKHIPEKRLAAAADKPIPIYVSVTPVHTKK